MLDPQKAFDTVDHDILCRKLRAMGVESVEWFRSYLADRTHCLLLFIGWGHVGNQLWTGALKMLNSCGQGLQSCKVFADRGFKDEIHLQTVAFKMNSYVHYKNIKIIQY
ncbi:hypothetical protein DPMN_066704 [Dreissena polymorpha]|uniref:Reverse transcriptase domain-containing protein n=1 Tax=Dreissena polymorpha TaxID=45954 RepID=A0A9D3YU02_DREPO|nr:hypothetical protein DPMN_066704 [Dreissena polymorpha]